MNTPSVTIADRAYSLQDLQDLMVRANTAPEEADRALATFEVASLSLFAQLTQAQALMEIAQHLRPQTTSTHYTEAPPVIAFPDAAGPGRTREEMLADASHDHPVLASLRLRVITENRPVTYSSAKRGTLKIFYEALSDPRWQHTLEGRLIREDQAIAFLDEANPPSDS